MLVQYYAKDNKLKALKRLYALMRMEKNIDMSLLLHDFTQRSIVGKYNVIVNNLKVYIYIIENYAKDFGLNRNKEREDKLGQHIIFIQSLIQLLYNPYDKYLRKINLLIEDYIYIDEVINFGDKEAIKKCIFYGNKIIDYFTKIIDKLSTEFIKTNKINFENYL